MGEDVPFDFDGGSGREEGVRPAPATDHEDPDGSLMDAEDVAQRLKVSVDWVWDHSSRRAPFLPAIWLSDGVVRYRRHRIDEFIDERERLSRRRRKRR